MAADDGSISLAELNFSNSVEGDTPLAAAKVRRALGFGVEVRFEHHVTETFKLIVRQSHDRRVDVVTAAATVLDISAKDEGGDPHKATRDHPSDMLERNYLDKHAAVNETAAALTRAGIGVRAAALLHAATDTTSGVADTLGKQSAASAA